MLIAYGITECGRRCVLGVSVELSEAEVHWRKSLESLIVRGLHGLKLIVSDNHVGLKAARMSIFCSAATRLVSFSAKCHYAYSKEKYAAGGTQRHSWRVQYTDTVRC